MVLVSVFYLFGVLSPLAVSKQTVGVLQTPTPETIHSMTTLNTMDSLNKWFVSGEPPRGRFFSDRDLGIRFRIPWKDYQTKTPRQIQSLIEQHQAEKESAARSPYDPAGPEGEGVTYILAIYPRSAKRARPGDQGSSTVVKLYGGEQPYVPFLVVWYQSQPTLLDFAALRNLTFRLKLQWRFARLLQAMPWISQLAETTNGLFPLIPPVPERRLQKVTWQDSGQRIFVDLDPVRGLRRRVMIQAARGKLFYFGLYYQEPGDRVLLNKLGNSLKIHPSHELVSERGASWFSGILGSLGVRR